MEIFFQLILKKTAHLNEIYFDNQNPGIICNKVTSSLIYFFNNHSQYDILKIDQDLMDFENQELVYYLRL